MVLLQLVPPQTPIISKIFEALTSFPFIQKVVYSSYFFKTLDSIWKIYKWWLHRYTGCSELERILRRTTQQNQKYLQSDITSGVDNSIQRSTKLTVRTELYYTQVGINLTLTFRKSKGKLCN
jgi:hypothetical protein